jgi:hypothetical protein
VTAATTPTTGKPPSSISFRSTQKLALSLVALAQLTAQQDSGADETSAVDRELQVARITAEIPGLIRRVSAPVREALEPTATAPTSDLTANEAAALLCIARPDGTPRDSFYKLAPRLGGYRVAGNQWRIPREAIERFKRTGGASS